MWPEDAEVLPIHAEKRRKSLKFAKGSECIYRKLRRIDCPYSIKNMLFKCAFVTTNKVT